jgi:O-antigen ligase
VNGGRASARELAPVGLGLATGLAVSAQPLPTALGLVGLGVVLLGAARPPLLVVGMWLGMLFDRLGTTGATVGAFPVTAAKLAVVATAGLWTVHALVRGAPLVRWHPVLGAMGGLVLTTAVCVAWSDSLRVGRWDLAGLGMMTVLVALAYAILAEADLAPVYRSVGVVFVLVLVSSLLGTAGSGEAARATGTMGDPNEWATIVLLVTPFLLGGLAADERRLSAALRMALVLLAPLAVLRSGSRAALVVGALTLLGCLWILRRRRRELGVAGALALLAGPLALDVDVALTRMALLIRGLRFGAQAEDPSFAERSELFRQGVQLFRDHWLLGAGPGNFALATGFVSTTGTLRPSHNTFLKLAGEQGLLGLGAAGVLVVVVGLTLRDGLRAARRPDDEGRLLGVAVGLCALGAMAATLDLLVFAMAWLVLGIGLAAVHQARRRPEPAPHGAPRAVRA